MASGNYWCRFLFIAAAALYSAALAHPVSADEFRTPAISIVKPDWPAAVNQLKAEIDSQPLAADSFSFTGLRPSRQFGTPRLAALSQLNTVTSPIFPGAELSPVPVLLPFDSARYLADRRSGAGNLLIARHQAGFRAASMFEAGPAGYDAVFMLDRGAGDNMPSRVYSEPVEVQITASLLIYDIKDPLAGQGEPVKALATQFPNLRRVIREGYVRYAFTRFGVPYVVTIQCLDSVARSKRLSCREASPVAELFLKSLRVAGGTPRNSRFNIDSYVSERPAEYDADFTYRIPGEIIANSGYRGQGGHQDFTVYSQIRFPIEKAPAFANSQSFMNWGDCNLTGRVSWAPTKGDPYRCKRNDKPLVFDESAMENYSYPWQDNFCETRDFGVGQCANGMGHQGQDIRPSSCHLRNDGADRCMPDIFPTVAVRDGVLVRTPKQQAVFLLVNTRNEHIRFRYIHMNPARLDADGVVHGRRVAEGERIGVVSNFQDRPGGTTSHLHFDIQVFTRDGWLWVNPYVTLISSYERLIGGRGHEYIQPPPEAPAMAHAMPPADAPAGAAKDDSAR
ncbi:peptidoglycan DD-metalloendopeptidase family protein [soil metagenome]